MKRTDEGRLTASEIAGIISSCAAANVRVFEIPGMRLEFGAKEQASPPHPGPRTPEPPSAPEPTHSEHVRINQETLEIDEARLKDDRLALMLIEDPLEAEKLIASGELDLEEGGDDDES